MKVPDRHFLKYAGAGPARLMRKEQRAAHEQYVRGLTYEKPPEHPDRPSVIDRKTRENTAASLPETDRPSKILEDLGAGQPAARLAEESAAPLPPGLSGGENSGFAAACADQCAPPGTVPPQAVPAADTPSLITASLSGYRPPQGETAPPAGLMDMPADMRGSQAAAPEQPTGRVVSEKA